MCRLTHLLVAVFALTTLSCSEPELVAIEAADVSLVSCNGGSAQESLALYVEFLVDNAGDEPVDIIGVELVTEQDGVEWVSGSQAITSVEVGGGEAKAFTCKDGFTVSYPGENTLTDISLRVTYRQAEAEVTMVRYLEMDTTVVWDNCGGFLGNARTCAPQ